MRFHLTFSSKKDNCSVYIGTSYRDENGKPRNMIIERCGNRKNLLAANPNAIEELQAKVDQLNKQAKELSVQRFLENNKIVDKLLLEKLKQNDKQAITLKGDRPVDKCLGLLPFKKLWEQLNLPYKMRQIGSVKQKLEYDFSAITEDMSVLRCLSPSSKRRSSKQGPRDYLGFRAHKLDHIYKSLDVLSRHKAEIIQFLNRAIEKEVGNRQTEVCLYDITTYAFESVQADSLRDFGYSKDKKFNEVQVVMALASDPTGIPMNYALYKGNQGECATMIPFVDELKKQFGTKHFIVVADRALNSTVNIDGLIKLGNDYVIAHKIRGAGRALQQEALSEQGRLELISYDENGEIIDRGWYKEVIVQDTAKYSLPKYAYEFEPNDSGRDLHRRLNHQMTGGKKPKVEAGLTRRLIITYSQARANKDQKDRARLIKKAKKLLAKPSELKAQYKRGGRSLITVDIVDGSIGLDEKLIEKQEKFDGIHVVETSLSRPVKEVLGMYHELWRIEHNFRLLKSQLAARPVFVRTEDHIRGHFLICYLALVLIRLLERRLKNADKKSSIDEVIDALNQLRTSKHEIKGLPRFYSTGEPLKAATEVFGVCGLQIPDSYELDATLKTKLGLRGAMKEKFNTK